MTTEHLPVAPAVNRLREFCIAKEIDGKIEIELILIVNLAIEIDRINSDPNAAGASPLYGQLRHYLDGIREHVDKTLPEGEDGDAFTEFLDKIKSKNAH